jgi:preprotein translocase subunit SecG
VLETTLYAIFFVSCVLLIVSVLLQPGKTDAGALFTSNISSAALNPRGTQSVLSKLTIVMAATFMLSALLLAMPAVTGRVSVLETQGPTKTGAADTEAANSNTSPAANTSNTSGTSETAKPAEGPKDDAAKAPVEQKEAAAPAKDEKKDGGK